MSLIAVTGATGHLGACLVRQLLERGHTVRALVRSDDPASLRGLEIERVRGDICDPDSLQALVRGTETLYHLAGLISLIGPMGGKVWTVNVGGTRNAGQAALDAGVTRMVHVSSVHAFRHK